MSTPLLLLPGHMCDVRLWSDCAPPLRGAGCTLRFAELTSAASIETLADDALALAPPTFIAVGFSMGGIVALTMARRAPGRVKGLVLIDTTADADGPARLKTRLDLEHRVRAGDLADVVRDDLKPRYFASTTSSDHPARALSFQMAVELGADVFLRQSAALRARIDLRSHLHEIAAPTLLLCGAQDTLCPPTLHDAMAEALPSARVVVVPDAGHMTPLEQPFYFAGAVLRWRAQDVRTA